MFQSFLTALKVADLRKKILFTLFVIMVFRLGSAITVPFLDPAALKQIMETVTGSGTFLDFLNIMSGGGFERATLFAMSVTPYINASIIIQLLTVAIPALEKLSKEGEEGRKKLGKITRYATVVLGLLEGTAFYFFLRGSITDANGSVIRVPKYVAGFEGFFTAVIIIVTLTAGSALMMWLGEQINEKGIGNGISILLFAGIVSRGPATVRTLWAHIQVGLQGNVGEFGYVIAIIVLFVAIIGFIVFMNDAERRIPIQYAKRVVGRKMYGGQSSFMPVKVNMSGVLPIIFASSILTIPVTIAQFAPPKAGSFWDTFVNLFKAQQSWAYVGIYFLLILGFSYFYVSIQYNPLEMANNLKNNNGTVPGIRPGRPTAEFIAKIIKKITLVGALMLSVVVILPLILGIIFKQNLSLGGTSVIILVGVALETVRSIESQMMMRHYKGFLQ